MHAIGIVALICIVAYLWNCSSLVHAIGMVAYLWNCSSLVRSIGIIASIGIVAYLWNCFSLVRAIGIVASMGNSSVMDVALCTQKSTFWHQYIEKYLCIVIFNDAGCLYDVLGTTMHNNLRLISENYRVLKNRYGRGIPRNLFSPHLDTL